jgi:hypothetical protein
VAGEGQEWRAAAQRRFTVSKIVGNDAVRFVFSVGVQTVQIVFYRAIRET